MSLEPRYAIYFVPAADTDLYAFGCGVLGYDIYSGNTRSRFEELTGASWDRWAVGLRRHGFHAALKAPFHLSPNRNETELVSALRSYAALGPAVPTVTPLVDIIEGFIALVPDAEDHVLDSLARSCATIFDAFRAPMTAAERARRVASGLSPSQIYNLDRWGYPFVFSDFRFRMTLTGKIESDQSAVALATLRALFARSSASRPFAIDGLALVRQDAPEAAFQVLARVDLSATG